MFREKLVKRLKDASINITEDSIRRLVIFNELLNKENAKMNLTRITDEDEAVDLNYIDSLSPLMFPGIDLNGVKAADIGSGAGFPGLIIACVSENSDFSLFDSQLKRVNFLETAIRETGIQANAYHMRAEDASRQSDMRECFDLVTSRAVANLATLAEYALPLLKVGGEAVLWKGPGLKNEIKDGKPAVGILGGTFKDIYDVHLEGRDWQHRLLVLKKSSHTPIKYPRRNGFPLKRPLGNC